MVPSKKVDKTPYELWYEKVFNLSYLKVWGWEALVKRDTPDKHQYRSVKLVARYAEFLKKNLISQEVNGRAVILEEIQDKDTSPSEEAPVRRPVRTHRAPKHLCLNVEADEHSLRDLNEPANYKAAMLDPESNKCLDAMNAKMQSMKDNQTYLGKCFAMKDLGEAAFIVRIKIYRDKSKRLIRLSQYAYMDEILKGASTLEEVKGMQNVPYALTVGSIMYAVRCARPDVTFAQNITSYFQQNLGESHWTAMNTILKYLRNTKDMFLVYGGNPEAELDENLVRVLWFSN
uniref:Retrotransposon protein, putative, Ty1-copia subclass n=1 Tax=Tanacetum cinerariifolium TaxID=118510 RepID=A0A6L2J2K2_TANCI|nr:hypothetical protein [Tanacetum cinerariifolium]